MTYNPSQLFNIPLACALDLILGDPQWHWHPVRIIGKLIQTLEAKLNTEKGNRKFRGMILVILVVGLVVFNIWAILEVFKLIHPVLYYISLVIFIYFAVSVKDLGTQAKRVYNDLENGNVQLARRNLSMIVARDTYDLEKSEIIRATVETVAESTMDGIIAPLFYAFLGGPILAWAYKAINTLDSMVGYRSERFIDFGWAAAKLDGLVNFIPAKITSFLIFVSSWFSGKNWRCSAKWAGKYFLKWPKDNSEATEAAMAGALGIQLGGLNFYDSVPIQKPLTGENLSPLGIRHIKESIGLAYLSFALILILGSGLIWILKGR